MEERTKNRLDDDRIGRLLLSLSIPSFFSMFVSTLYNYIDTIFIGHYVGPLGIAGLSMVFPIQMLSIGIGLMTGVGGASLMSRSIGAGDISKAERTLGNAVTATILLCLMITVAGLADVELWLRLMGTSPTILPYARDYMTIILFGMFFQTYGLALSFLIRAEGNTIVPMIGMVGGAIANTILCAIFIVGMGMGVKGSALATVIAEVISVIYFMSYYFTGKSYLKFRLRDLMPLWGILKEIMVIGISAMVMMLAGSVSSIIVNRSVVAFGGDLAMAAFGVLNRITMLTWMPSIVVGEGMQPILGFNYGARRYDRTLKVIRLASIAATVLSIMAFAVCYFVPAPLMRIFTDDSAVITQGVYAIRRIVLLAFLTGVTEIGSMVFQSIGKAVPSFITSVARPILFLIPLVLILPMYLQLDGVWLAFPITDGLAFLLTIALFIPQLRQFQRLSRPAATST